MSSRRVGRLNGMDEHIELDELEHAAVVTDPGEQSTSGWGAVGATVDDVRSLALGLERSYEVFVHDRRKFRVGKIVYLGFSRDETIMGFAFPKEEREALVASDPETFMFPRESEMRFNWVCARLAALDPTEARELVVDAWRMCVPKKLSRAYDA